MSFLRDPKRLLATLIAGIAGLIVLIDVAGEISPISTIARILVDWSALLIGIALLIGVINVLGTHIAAIRSDAPARFQSGIIVATAAIVVVSGTLIGGNLDGSGFTLLPQSLAERPVRDLFLLIYQPLAGSFLGLLTFFSIGAALRAAGSGNIEAVAIVAIAAVVLMIGALPNVAALAPLVAGVRWFEAFVALAGARGLLIGAALGAIVAGVRVILGVDQPYLDR